MFYVCLGQEQSVGVRAPPDLHLDMGAFPDVKDIPLSLSTPPRVLKVDEIMHSEEEARQNLEEPETTSLISDEPPNGYLCRTPHKDNR